MNLNVFSKWLQYNGVKNVRGSEYFPYPLCIYIYIYATIQKYGVSKCFFQEINTFIQQGCIKFIKSDSKVIFNLIIIKNIYIYI